MADKSAIEWTDATWNPTRGCSRVSEGCRNCYAEVMAARFSKRGQWGHAFAEMKGGDHRWTGRVQLVESQLDLPLHWKKPRRIFVNSTSDLFHESLPGEVIDRVFAVMALAPQHTFQALTKRAERMRTFCSDPLTRARVWDAADKMCCDLDLPEFSPRERYLNKGKEDADWSLSNVWLGVSVEDQVRADERIPLLLQTPAAVRFISAEPLLGPLSLTDSCNGAYFADFLRGKRWHDADHGAMENGLPHLDWVIVGGESGPGARAFNIEWARSILSQCTAANIPCFVKQLGSNPRRVGNKIGDTGFVACPSLYLKAKKGGDWSEWPEDLRVRKFPKVAA